jgi:hypothetical protein
MRAKEKKDDFNFKLMKILERIEKKMDKEIESSRSRSHRCSTPISEIWAYSRSDTKL